MANILIGGVNLKTLGMHDGVANPKKYGAKCDDSTDDTAIAQAVIEALEAIGGGVFQVPIGGMVVTSPLQHTSGVVHFEGIAGNRINNETFSQIPLSMIHLVSATEGEHALELSSAAQGGAVARHIRHITFRGEDVAGQGGILVDGDMSYGSFIGILFHSFGAHGISWDVGTDPGLPESYSQNVSIRDCQFVRCGGLLGLLPGLTASQGMLCGTLLEITNIAHDATQPVSPAPDYILDLRGWREVVIQNLNTEGAGAATPSTSIIAVQSTLDLKIEQWHSEYASNEPTYSIMCFGRSDGSTESPAENSIRIGRWSKQGGAPIWFEDDATNETSVSIEQLREYGATSIDDVVEWENGVSVNKSGRVDINTFQCKNAFAIPEAYQGRFKCHFRPMDMQSNYRMPVLAPRCLFRWNPSMGTMFKDFGEVECVEVPTSATWAIEDDDGILCFHMTGLDAHASKYPRHDFRCNKDFLLDYQGANVVFAMRYRATIDASDSGKTPILTGATPTGWEDYYDVNDAVTNDTEYQTAIAIARIGPDAGSDLYRFQFATSATLTVVGELRVTAVEIWLGEPDHLELLPAYVDSSPVPTFGAADATPSVSGHKVFQTGTSTLTITDFLNGLSSQEITVISKAAITFDTTSTNLTGSSVDLVTASGDVTRWVCEDGTTWRLIGFVDASVDNSGGA